MAMLDVPYGSAMPIERTKSPGAPKSRSAAAVVLAASASVLALALWLEPSAEGVGTHTQLGLPSCGFHASTGLPCASCGMTTSFSYAAHGRLLSAFLTQPAGAFLAVLTAAAAVVSAYALTTGMRLRPVVSWMSSPITVAAGAGIVVAAWGYKMTLALWAS